MGDMADWIVENDPWINGDGFMEPHDEEDEMDGASLTLCKLCGVICEWHQVQGNWRLFNEGGGKHHCEKMPPDPLAVLEPHD